MDFGLSNQEKLATLVSLRSNTNAELYQLLARCGVDPDTFTSVEEIPDALGMPGEKARIQALVNSLDVINGKITELS